MTTTRSTTARDDVRPRPTDVGREEMNTTRFERFLAVVLGVFLLIGLLWLYAQPLDRTDDRSYYDTYSYVTEPQPGDRELVRKLDEASTAVGDAQQDVALARTEVAETREAYRTRLDANEPADTYKKTFEDAERSLTAKEATLAAAQAAYAKVEPAGRAAQQRYDDAISAERERLERQTFLGRLGLAVASILLAFLMLHQLHRRRQRYTLLGMSAVGAATGLAVTMTGDYIDIREAGPVVLSIAGTLGTLAAFVAYQRRLARRLPERRVRKGECPFCGYPANVAAPADAHCQGCGRSTVGACTTCEQPRRVGARYCGACGAA